MGILGALISRVLTPMTTTPNPEPNIQGLSAQMQSLSDKIDKLSTDVERSNDKFDAYQKGTQWVVQLAFTLIASATLTVILSTVFK